MRSLVVWSSLTLACGVLLLPGAPAWAQSDAGYERLERACRNLQPDEEARLCLSDLRTLRGPVVQVNPLPTMRDLMPGGVRVRPAGAGPDDVQSGALITKPYSPETAPATSTDPRTAIPPS